MRKDVDNYDKLMRHLSNFDFTDRKEIEDFIVKVRSDNPVYSAICQLQKVAYGPLRKLCELAPDELYVELRGEIQNVVFKGAYDSLKLLNNLDDKQCDNLVVRIVAQDMTIFTDYKC
ncbi:MAG: hypothetical protein NC489_43950 [Ruminococcus flavefaciens]|nr:hypothetical protein [Ruminococcus flavefaciens]